MMLGFHSIVDCVGFAIASQDLHFSYRSTFICFSWYLCLLKLVMHIVWIMVSLLWNSVLYG